MRLTLQELRAIEESLSARLAGEIDIEDAPGALRHENYFDAHRKICNLLLERERKAKS